MPTLPAAEASVDELIQLIQFTIRAEHQVAAIRAEAIAEQRRRQGIEHPESVL
ncbi:MAG: hypothetical protein OXC98_02480 [bacterium]|nr:hypothetical protein [Acidimicrobiia bacterium]MCY4649223.1 hypothetical protein [bacterium]